jgi:hypothetical protein
MGRDEMSLTNPMFFERRIMREGRYQSDLIRKLRDLFPGCMILKNDSSYLQGVPDLLILYRNKWAMLEVKPSHKAEHQVNQDYYVGLLDDMSFASFIYPENEEEVLYALQSAFRSERATRLPQRQ